MKRFKMSILLIVTLISVFSCTVYQKNRATISDEAITLVVNADIVTMDPKKPSASTMAISGDQIVAIGSKSEVRAAIGSYAKFYNLEGRTIVPGFFESHDHLYMSSATAIVTDVTPFTTPTLAATLEKIRQTEPDDEGWIIAFGAGQHGICSMIFFPIRLLWFFI